jgi:signal transduction histidine kinase
MHPYVLVPLASTMAAGALASAVAVRASGRPTHRLMSLILACAGCWSLFELLFAVEADPERAAQLLRWSYPASLAIAPLSLHFFSVSAAREQRWLRRWLVPAYSTTFLCALATVTSDRVLAGAQPASWGWTALAGPALPVVYAAVVGIPCVAVAASLWPRPGQPRPNLRLAGLRPLGILALSLAALTDFALPLLGVPSPRLGSPCLVAWGALACWSVYRLRESSLAAHEFAREILDTLPDGVALVRTNARIRTSNAQLGRLAELPPAQLMGMPISSLLVDTGEPEAGEPGEKECELVSASGHRIPVSVARAPLMDDETHLVGHVLVVRDLREVVSLRSRLATSGRLAAVGQLAAGIAHEINNPIAYVRSNLALLEEHWRRVGAELEKNACGPLVGTAFREGPEILTRSCEGVDQVASIVREIGGFSSGGVAGPANADLVELLDAAVRVAAPQTQGVRIERDYAACPRISCIPQELMQLFLNLLVNAGQALPGGGAIRLATRQAGDDVLVEVADDGAGIEAELLGRIFEPFFTTKPVGQGTGLGLSVAHQIVTSHGGSIRADSEPGRGTRFQVRLPLRPSVGEVPA